MSYELQEARELVIKAGLALVENGLIARTWGNISARISDTQFVITPSGRSYESLIPEDIVIVNIKDCSFEGEIKPSGEKATHAEVYRQKSDVNFVVHTHQPYASAVSILGEDVDNLTTYNGLASARQNYEQVLGSRIVCAKYSLCCTDALARNVKAAIKRSPDSNAAFLKNHGIVAMGKDYDDAFLIAQCAEEVCKSKYDYLTGSFFEEADRSVEANYGSSYRDSGYIYLTVDEASAKWPVGYAATAKKEDVPKALHAIAMLHDTFYQDANVEYVSHVTSPFIVTLSRLKEGKLKRGFRPYIDDQAQIAGTDIKTVKLRIRRNKLKNVRKVEKLMDDHAAILLSSGGAIVYGKTKDDIEAISAVLEKGCTAAVIGHLITAIKPIPKKICKQMRTIYRDSYSQLKDYGMTATKIKEIEELS